MTTQYKLQKDVAGYNGFGLPFCDLKYSATLPTGVNTTVAVPLSGAMGTPLNSINKWLAVIQVEANVSVWLSLNAVATVPAGATFGLTGSDLIIGSQYYAVEVRAGDVMNFITATADTDVLVKFFALQAS